MGMKLKKRSSSDKVEQQMTPMIDIVFQLLASRASIVNIERVRELQPMFNGDFVVVLKDGSEVPGSRRYRESIDRFLG